MNEKFFHLALKKQEKIIAAGFRVFSQNSYRKSPMSEIAAEAGISKSLLFHYFRNKKELYLYLWNYACQMTIRIMDEGHCYEPDDLFVMMEKGMKAKFQIIEQHPDMAVFIVKAFYEKDPEVVDEIQESFHQYFNRKAAGALAALNPADFVSGVDLKMMYREMYLASEGYLWETLQDGKLQDGKMDVRQMEQDFQKLLCFWKSIYRHQSEENQENHMEEKNSRPEAQDVETGEESRFENTQRDQKQTDRQEVNKHAEEKQIRDEKILRKERRAG